MPLESVSSRCIVNFVVLIGNLGRGVKAPLFLRHMPIQIYKPFICNIIAITQALNAVVTVSIAHGFTVGNQVQFFIPPRYGMSQINFMKAIVIALDTFTVTVNINSTNFDPFSIPTPMPFVVLDLAQIAPIGDYNAGFLAPGGVQPVENFIPGAFAPVLT